MMRYLVVLAASVAAVLAQVTVNTPQGVLACTNTQVTWTGGAAPYILQIQPGGDTSAAAIETFTGITGTSFTWHVIEQANTQVFLRLHDSNGLIGESGTFTIQSAGSTVCSGTTGGTSAVASATGAAGTTAAATTPAVGATTPAATTPAVGATTPATGATTTPAAAGGSSSTTHAASSSTTSHSGATSLQVAGGLVGLIGAVAVALA